MILAQWFIARKSYDLEKKKTGLWGRGWSKVKCCSATSRPFIHHYQINETWTNVWMRGIGCRAMPRAVIPFLIRHLIFYTDSCKMELLSWTVVCDQLRFSQLLWEASERGFPNAVHLFVWCFCIQFRSGNCFLISLHFLLSALISPTVSTVSLTILISYLFNA